MFMVTVWDHVIGKFRDHEITFAFFLRRELRWAWKLSIKEWEPGEKPPNLIKKTEEENRGTMKTS